MIPFTYQRADSVDAALRLGREPGASFLAGGTELVNWLKDGIATPPAVIDIGRLPLDRIEVGADVITIGGLARLADVARHPHVGRVLPGLVAAIESAASPQIRAMGTLAGNLLQRTRCPYFRAEGDVPCNKRRPGSGCGLRSSGGGLDRNGAIFGASAACAATHPSDPAVMLAALDAELELQRAGGSRTIPLRSFYRLPGTTPEVETELASGELIVAIRIRQPGGMTTYRKVRDRAAYDFALVSAAAVGRRRADRLELAALTLGGVAPMPWRLEEAERRLSGAPADEPAIRAAIERSLVGAAPLAGNRFKIDLVLRVATRAVLDLAERE
jgi:xanthine dehydrogenase YagS FAD-binding subunit